MCQISAELGLQAVVSLWVMGIELGSSTRAGTDHRAISPVQCQHFKNLVLVA